MTSRLYRATAGIARPLFTVTSGGRTWTDGSIHRITITHGKSNPEGGLYPATAEVEVAGAVNVLHDRDISVQLSSAASSALAQGSGAVHRFTGRVATQQVTTHARRGRGPAHTSTLRCSSWSSLYLAAGAATTMTNSFTLDQQLQIMFDRVQRKVGKAIPLTFRGTWSDQVHGSQFDGAFSDYLTDYYAEPGYLLRQKRAGDLEVLPLLYRWAEGENALKNWWPLTLGHAFTGVEHEQKTDVSAVGIRLTWTEPDGAGGARTITRDWAWPGSSDGVPASEVLEWREYDWSHILFNTEQYRHGINAISHQAFRVAFTTPRLKVDLLALAARTDTYSRQMLRQLLTLEQGDPVIFGGDWSARWNGIYYAERITETIAADEWSLELSLYPTQEVTGHYGNGQPTAAPRIWSQATRQWDHATTEWS